MQKFKAFAIKRPILFGLLLIVIYSLLSTLSYPVHFLFPDTETGQLLGDALSRAIVFLCFLYLLWRFGWIGLSGIKKLRLGWMKYVIALILLYKIAAELYAFTGSPVPVQVSGSEGITQAVYYLTGSLVEEIMCRSLILLAMLHAWGETREGIYKSVVLSSVVFGLTHLFNLITDPVGQVLLQTAVVILPGILYAALFLHTGSLWPAILIHWLTNTAVNIKISTIADYTDTPSMWLNFGLLMLPLIAYSYHLVRKASNPVEQEI